MKQNEAEKLANNLVNKFGLPLNVFVNSGDGNQVVLLEPQHIHPHDGFRIRIEILWRGLNFEFVPGKYASDLLEQMSSCPIEKKNVFSSIVQSIEDDRGQITFRINDILRDPLTPESWPTLWKSITYKLEKIPLEINTEDYKLTEDLINLWTERFFGSILSICPLEEMGGEEDALETIGMPEGSLVKVLVNRYERNKLNRTLCINFHGCRCKVCGIQFDELYGQIGEGFIHVHHVTPVSEIGNNYCINPIKDLVPVCPNCHAMLHKRKNPFTVDELKLRLKK